MTEAVSLNNCCGVLEIGFFPYDGQGYSVEGIQEQIESSIVQESIIDCVFDDPYDYTNPPRIYNFFIATTRTTDQSKAEQALKNLGFRSRLFKSKAEPDLMLHFWFRRGLPRHLNKKIKQELKEESQ